jgi:hypothetical protein
MRGRFWRFVVLIGTDRTRRTEPFHKVFYGESFRGVVLSVPVEKRRLANGVVEELALTEKEQAQETRKLRIVAYVCDNLGWRARHPSR